MNLNGFSDKISELFSKVKHENKIKYLMGDFNINILDSDSNLHMVNFIETMYSYSMFPLIIKPARVTNTTATLIDNIFCNDLNSR